jgi:hypothetical protein
MRSGQPEPMCRKNYDASVSAHTSQNCPETPSFGGTVARGRCSCGFRYDFERSANMIPADHDGNGQNPKDPRVIESICDTQDLDDFFINTQEGNQPF